MGLAVKNRIYLSCIKGKRLFLDVCVCGVYTWMCEYSFAVNPLLVTISAEIGLWHILLEFGESKQSFVSFRKIHISTSRMRSPARWGTPHQPLGNQREGRNQQCLVHATCIKCSTSHNVVEEQRGSQVAWNSSEEPLSVSHCSLVFQEEGGKKKSNHSLSLHLHPLHPPEGWCHFAILLWEWHSLWSFNLFLLSYSHPVHIRFSPLFTCS